MINRPGTNPTKIREDEFAAHPPQQPALGPDDARQRVATGKQQGKAAKGVEGLHHRRARRDPPEDCGDRLDGRTNQRGASRNTANSWRRHSCARDGVAPGSIRRVDVINGRRYWRRLNCSQNDNRVKRGTVKLKDTARFNTVCIHAGHPIPRPAPSSPDLSTSTYVQEGLGQHKGFETGARRTPLAWRSKQTWQRSSRAPPHLPSPRAWPRLMPS